MAQLAFRSPGSRRPKRGVRGPNFTDDQKEQIVSDAIAAVARGVPLAGWCRTIGRPSMDSLLDWIVANKDWADRMAAARISGAHALASECLVIADAWRPSKDPNAHPLAGAPADDRRLAVWTRLQLLARWFPALYGEKRQHSHDHQVRSIVLHTGAPMPSSSVEPVQAPAKIAVDVPAVPAVPLASSNGAELTVQRLDAIETGELIAGLDDDETPQDVAEPGFATDSQGPTSST